MMSQMSYHCQESLFSYVIICPFFYEPESKAFLPIQFI